MLRQRRVKLEIHGTRWEPAGGVLESIFGGGFES
jgi:hypothetical protein